MADLSLERLVRRHLKHLPETDALAPDQDLKLLGLDSMAAVDLMIAIEDEFEIVVPDELLMRGSLSTLRNLDRLVTSLIGGEHA